MRENMTANMTANGMINQLTKAHDIITTVQ